MKKYICRPEEFEIYSFNDINSLFNGYSSYMCFKGLPIDCPNGNYYRFLKNDNDPLDKYVLHKSLFVVFGDQGTFKIINKDQLEKFYSEIL